MYKSTYIFDKLIKSYSFIEMDNVQTIRNLNKCYVFSPSDVVIINDFDEIDGSKLYLYWFHDNTFSLYRTESMIKCKLCSDKLNIYNLKLSLEKFIPNKCLKVLNNND